MLYGVEQGPLTGCIPTNKVDDPHENAAQAPQDCIDPLVRSLLWSLRRAEEQLQEPRRPNHEARQGRIRGDRGAGQSRSEGHLSQTPPTTRQQVQQKKREYAEHLGKGEVDLVAV